MKRKQTPRQLIGLEERYERVRERIRHDLETRELAPEARVALMKASNHLSLFCCEAFAQANGKRSTK